MQTRVIADYRKWPDAQHYLFLTRRLGEDEYGTWLGLRAGTGFRGPRIGTFPTDILLLVPRNAWWLAKFRGVPDDVPLYVDVCTPARWKADRVTTIDLDLDVLRQEDGTVRIDDEDEFAAHRLELNYPDWLAEGAIRATAEVRSMVEGRVEPFDRAHEAWFARLAAATQDLHPE